MNITREFIVLDFLCYLLCFMQHKMFIRMQCSYHSHHTSSKC
uniref:Uncharacterized protein n=1 Tax=Rhizophora mucronata TaxID=61149 RepID=A0A2P2Q058_RHIMU